MTRGDVQRPKWTRAEETLLLRAWRDVLRGVHASHSRAQDMRHVDARMHETFVAYGGSAVHETFVAYGGNAVRSRSAVEGKQRRLLTMYQLIVRHDDWFAMSSETQRRLYAEHSGTTELVKLDRHMCAILAKIDRMRRLKVADAGSDETTEPPSPAAAAKGRKRHPWTDGETWLLIAAWRQVISETNKPARVAQIYTRFCALKQEWRKATPPPTMPERSAWSLNAKRLKLVQAYNLIDEYNQRQLDDAEDGTVPRTWYSLSAATRKECLIRQSVNPRYYVPDISQDLYNALAIIMRQEMLNGGMEQGMDPAGADDIGFYSDSDADDSGWEMLPSSPTHLNFTPETRPESRRHSATLAGGQVRSRSSSDSEENDASRMQVLNQNVYCEIAKSRKSKRKHMHEADDYQRFMRELKREMERNKKEHSAMLVEIEEEIRKLRKERTKIAKLVEGQRTALKQEKESRTLEREEWESERECMLHKLSKMRDRYKKTTKKLKARLAQV